MNVAASPEDDQILHLLGLPRYQQCSFALNNSFYIFGGEYPALSSTTTQQYLDGFRLNFTTIDTPPTMDNIFNNNSTNNTASSSSSLLNDIALGAGCAVTSYGHALFLPPGETLLTFNLLTHEWNLPDNVQGAPSALAAFSNETIAPPLPGTTVTSTSRRRDMVSAMWSDMWIIFGGRLAGDEDNFTQDTFILDARMPAPWVWFESPMTVNTPPVPSIVSRGMMVATSRWVLYFAINLTNSTNSTTQQSSPSLDNSNTARPYDITVHCFDPYVLLWVGQITNFSSTTDQLKAAPFAADSVLVVPAYDTNITTVYTTSNLLRQNIIVPSQGIWRLDMASGEPTGTIQWIGNTGPFRPVFGGTVTRLTEDLIIMYGGIPFSHDSLRFWNTTSNAFVDPVWWRETQWNTGPTNTPTLSPAGDEGVPNILAIVLGSVLGSLGLIIFIIFIYYFCYYRKRRRENPSASSTESRSTGRGGRRSITPISIQTNFSPFHPRSNNNNNDTLIAGRPYSPPLNNNNNNQNDMNNTSHRRIMDSPEEDAKTWATHLRRTLSAVARKNRIRWSRSSPTPQSAALHHDMTQVSPTSDRPMVPSPLEEEDIGPSTSYHNQGPMHHEDPPDSPIVVIDMGRQQRIRERSRFHEHFDLLVPPESTIGLSEESR